MKSKTQLTLNLGRLFLGTLVFSVSNMALATTDKCKTEATEAARLIQGFNKINLDYTSITATLLEEDTTHDHLLNYKIEYSNPDTNETSYFSDTIIMQWQDKDGPEEKCVLENFERGGA